MPLYLQLTHYGGAPSSNSGSPPGNVHKLAAPRQTDGTEVRIVHFSGECQKSDVVVRRAVDVSLVDGKPLDSVLLGKIPVDVADFEDVPPPTVDIR